MHDLWTSDVESAQHITSGERTKLAECRSHSPLPSLECLPKDKLMRWFTCTMRESAWCGYCNCICTAMDKNSLCIFHSSNICFSFSLSLWCNFSYPVNAYGYAKEVPSLHYAHALACTAPYVIRFNIKAPQRELHPNITASADELSECCFRATWAACYTSSVSPSSTDIDENEHWTTLSLLRDFSLHKLFFSPTECCSMCAHIYMSAKECKQKAMKMILNIQNCARASAMLCLNKVRGWASLRAVTSLFYENSEWLSKQSFFLKNLIARDVEHRVATSEILEA